MILFSETIRTDNTLRHATEGYFHFLERSALPSASKIRSIMEVCLQNYPSSDRDELVQRLKSRPHHFDSGVFELFLHEYLIRLGFKLKIHPVLLNGSKPDFHVICPDGHKLYLEATCTSEDDGCDKRSESRKKIVLEALHSISHPHFKVDIEGSGSPKSQPSGKRLGDTIMRWLNELDLDDIIIKCRDNHDALPELRWQHDGWSLRIRPIPLEIKNQNKFRCLYSAYADIAPRSIDGWTPIRNNIQKKIRQYGKVDLPLVIAVNTHARVFERTDEIQALFGEKRYFIDGIGTNQSNLRSDLAPNGAWRGPDRPRGKGCSGAWLFSNLTPCKFAHAKHTLYIHPYANLPLPESFLHMPHAKVVNEQVKYSPGKFFHEVFDLSERWPNDD